MTIEGVADGSPYRIADDGTSGPPEPLYTLHPKRIWRWLLTQPASFWFLNLYIFFEYIRPQTSYPIIDFLPWARLLILLALAAFIFEGKSFRLTTPADAALVFFSAVLVLSSVQAFIPQASYNALPDFFAWVLIYLLITGVVTTERRFLVTILAFLLYSFKMSQAATRSWAMDGFSYRDWGVRAGQGWFHNPGEFGIQMTLFIPMVAFFIFGLRKHWGKKTELVFWGVVLTAVLGTVASDSRGAMLGMAAVLVYMVLLSPYKANAIVGIVPMGVLAFFLLPDQSMDRFREMGDDGTSQSRLDYWAAGIEAMNEHPILGIGFENWPYYMRYNYEGIGLAHNIFVQAGAELGYTGLFALFGLIIATFVVNANTRAALKPLGERGNFLYQAAYGLDGALIGFLVSGSFVTVLYYPYLWFNLAFTVALHHSARNLIEEERRAPSRGAGVEQPQRRASRRPAWMRPSVVTGRER